VLLYVLCVEVSADETAKALTQKRQRSEEKPSHNIPLDNIRYNKYCWLMQRAAKPKRDPQAALEARAFVSLMRTADALARGAEALLKPYNISGTQYNVLRILRGAGKKGLACREVGGRLISRDPDMTRLLDRMESSGLIARAREAQDRRVVKTRITAEGLKLLGELDKPVHELHRRQWRHLSAKQLRQLSKLLDRTREHLEEPSTPD
jgi:DNA-binding MarR family transcriptional regulator